MQYLIKYDHQAIDLKAKNLSVIWIVKVQGSVGTSPMTWHADGPSTCRSLGLPPPKFVFRVSHSLTLLHLNLLQAKLYENRCMLFVVW